MKYLLILISGFILSLLFASTVLAKQDNVPKGKALGLVKQEQGQIDQALSNQGTIWTTDSDASVQDENHYQTGENVYLAGQKLPTGTLNYTIHTNPPSAQNGTVVVTGTVNVDENGDLPPTFIWTIPEGASLGVYKVVLSTGSHKSDNFQVVKAKIPEPEEKPPVTPSSQGGGQTIAQARVLGVKTLPATGPSYYLPLLLTMGLWLISIKLLGKKI
jgi:hypothetical protein